VRLLNAYCSAFAAVFLARSFGPLLYLDLDHFKTVNDEEGHGTGDRLLKAVAKRIQDTLRASDAAACMGGDEFSVLLVNANEGEAGDTARRLLECLGKPTPA